MGKNTHWLLLPQGSSKTSSLKARKEKDCPSELTIRNILNYSKALKISKGLKGVDFIEYLSN